MEFTVPWSMTRRRLKVDEVDGALGACTAGATRGAGDTIA